MERSQSQKRGKDDRQLAQLHPDIEGQKGHGGFAMGKPDFGQGTGKAEAVKQTENERDQPGNSFR